MQPVSSRWIENQRERIVGENFVEVSLAITDPDIDLDKVSLSVDDEEYISEVGELLHPTNERFRPYATLEQNQWLLDGNRRHLDLTHIGPVGYWSESIADDVGEFNPPLLLDIQLDDVGKLPGITIRWAPSYKEYASDFTVRVFDGQNVAHEEIVTGNKDVETGLYLDVERCDRVEIEITKWCLPRRRARMTHVFLGLLRVYDKSALTMLEHSHEISPVSATLPRHSVKFDIDNTLEEYNPQNPLGISKYLAERQEVRLRYGYIFDEEMEWIDGGLFHLSEWGGAQSGITATFEAKDVLGGLTDKYHKGMYRPSGINLYDLALEVLDEVELPNGFYLDDSLKDVYTVAPLPVASVAECLQLIAGAGTCVLYCDRQGVLRIEPAPEAPPISTGRRTGTFVAGQTFFLPLDTSMEWYGITRSNSYSNPEVHLTPILANVTVTTSKYSVKESKETVHKSTVSPQGTKTFLLNYSSPAADVVATVTGGTLEEAQYYTHTCSLTITGGNNVEIEVKGWPINVSQSVISVNVGEEGVDQELRNPLITTEGRASIVGRWVANHLMRRQIVTAEWRADPRLDALDTILLAGRYGKNRVQISSVKLRYTGAFRGSAEGRMLN
jgi:hypothetical protein